MTQDSQEEYTADRDSIRVRPRDGLVRRLTPTEDSQTALKKVHEQLAAATVLFERHNDSGRVGVFRAITDVIDYFSSQGIPRAALLPLSVVAAALVDAERGTENALFKPSRAGARPLNPVMQSYFEEVLAVVTECCVRHERSKGSCPFVEPGTKLAAKLVNESRHGTKVTHKQLREIRERVSQFRPGSSQRMQFDTLLDSQVAKDRPLEWAKSLIQHDWTQAYVVSG